MKTTEFTIESCAQTNHFIGIIPGLQGAHSQGDSIESLLQNLKEVCELLEIKDIQLSSTMNGKTYLIQL